MLEFTYAVNGEVTETYNEEEMKLKYDKLFDKLEYAFQFQPHCYYDILLNTLAYQMYIDLEQYNIDEAIGFEFINTFRKHPEEIRAFPMVHKAIMGFLKDIVDYTILQPVTSELSKYYTQNNIKEFGLELRNLLEKLGISQKYLGEKIGKGQVTISRYLNERNKKLPDEIVFKKIEAVIMDSFFYRGYHHRTKEEFAELLISFLKKANITQENLSLLYNETNANDKIKLSQKLVSQIINKDKFTDTELQYRIIKTIFDNVNSEDIKDEILSTLNYAGDCYYLGKENSLDKFLEMMNEDKYSSFEDEFLNEDRNLKKYILNAPLYLQDKIYQYNKVLLMLQGNVYDICTIQPYPGIEKLLSYRRKDLDVKERKRIEWEFIEIEENTHFFYPKSASQKYLWNIIETIYAIMDDEEFIRYAQLFSESINVKEIPEPDWSNDDVLEAETRYYEARDELCMFDCGSTELLHNMLSFSKYEWYIFMLYLISNTL